MWDFPLDLFVLSVYRDWFDIYERKDHGLWNQTETSLKTSPTSAQL